MDHLLAHLKETEYFQTLLRKVRSKRTVELSHATDALGVFLVYALFKELNRDVLVVNHNLYHAQKTYDILNELNNAAVSFFPQDEFLTTDMLAMSEDLKFQRLDTIKTLLGQEKNLVVTHTTGLLKYMLPKETFAESYKTYRVGDDVNFEAFMKTLTQLGYQAASNVEKAGDFAQRGSIVDLFLPGHTHPVRIDFFDTEIDSIRTFNVNTQRSLDKIESFTVVPRAEFFYDETTLSTIEKNVQSALNKGEYSEATIRRVQEELEDLNHYNNLDKLARYMAFSDKTPVTIADYLHEPLLITVNHERIEASYAQIREDLASWMVENGDYPKLGFSFMKDLDRIPYEKRVAINPLPMRATSQETFSLRAKESIRYGNDVRMLIKDLKRYEGHVTVLITLSDGKRMEKLSDVLEGKVSFKILGAEDPPFEKAINLTVSENPLSFEWFDTSFVLLSDRDIYKEITPTHKKKRRKVFKDSETISSVKSLEKGDLIVHYDHGIGRFLGVETMEVQNTTNDYIVIAYRGDDKLYIPVESVHLIQKYVSHEGVTPRLNKLGSAEWAKTKRRVRKKAKDIAKHLIDLYAKRQKAQGFAYSEDSDLMSAFEAEFPYEETEDQRQAIEEVKRDMESPQPMDRLICGDVGYGKTEVALRATFKAVLDNKQVVYLAPTTILSRQHYYTFKNRLEQHGIKIALLNRFVRKQKQNAFLEGIEKGSIDVVIGTHRLLSKDIKYKDLGLLIVDEEQRFGVEHKERIKQLKTQVDVLSLSATPIPRTLQMAMTDVKQMSLIETPPKDRFPVQTYVLRRNDHVIKDAIERELARNGQVFYLYNRVERIEEIADKLRRLVPDARFGVAHGQLNRMQLEKVMRAFLDHEFDVLVSTTIIETGLDIPNANTLIVHDADRLGLAQLYQIRGRVGRSNRIAYSYLMYSKRKQLNEEAAKRLQAIKEFTELGSGYKIAQRDLAIRGAGDLLGTEQSGFIDSVGIDLFMEILREEIDKEHKQQEQEEKIPEEKRQSLKLQVSRSIPKTYVQDDDMRIELHKKIAAQKSREHYEALVEECKDRFGPLPEELRHYMLEKLYEHLAVKAGVEKTRDSSRQIMFILSEEASRHIHGEMLFEKANELSRFIHLSYKKNRLHIMMEKGKIERPVLDLIVPLLENIQQRA